MKTVLITGASTGLGASLAVLLAERGHRVWATMRDPAKQSPLAAAAGRKRVALTIRQLDVQSTQSVNQCVAEMLAREGRLDVLVNNAGAGFIRATEQATEDDIRWVMDVNFMGVVRCTKAVIPHMRAARGGHIVNISSVGGLVGQPFNELYCAAKFAVEGYTEAMSSYMEEGFGLRFSIVEPGGIQSDFVKNVMAKTETTGGVLQDSYLPLLQRYLGRARDRAASDREGVFQTPDQVARVVADCIDSDDPPLRVRTSAWGEEFCRFKTAADPTGRLQQAAIVSRLL
jgi:NAD(P)-dependent dehydrogenase (short-subunit alcohol dehydrogenase family)